MRIKITIKQLACLLDEQKRLCREELKTQFLISPKRENHLIVDAVYENVGYSQEFIILKKYLEENKTKE